MKSANQILIICHALGNDNKHSYRFISKEAIRLRPAFPSHRHHYLPVTIVSSLLVNCDGPLMSCGRTGQGRRSREVITTLKYNSEQTQGI